MEYKNEFYKYATKHKGISSSNMDRYNKLMLPKMGYISPTIIEERQMNVASMDVFSRLQMDRIIFLGVPIDSTVANIIQAQLLFLESSDPKKGVQIYLNSPGGEISAGLGIIDVMNYITPDVSTINVGMCASMAAVILSCGKTRSALKHARTMIHQPSSGMHGTSIDLEISLKEVLKLKKELYDILAENTGQSYEKIENDSSRDYWMNSQEALEYHIIDEILERKS